MTTMEKTNKWLEGIQANEKLHNLCDEICSSNDAIAAHKTGDGSRNHVVDIGSSNDDVDVVELALRRMSKEDAVSAIHEYKSKLENQTERKYIPIKIIRAMEAMLEDQSESNTALDDVLLQNEVQLYFTPAPSHSEDENYLSNEQIKFRQRMARLRLKNEESKYSRLTNNLGLNPEIDDVTGKSMTYAASIGLNMIIAPLSFGCFMYFFAGGLLDFFVKGDVQRSNNPGPDIRKVIAGVVSGVLMLFIEMILFVIRTHEIDKAARRKTKKERPKPFGHYSSVTNRDFHTKDE